MHSAWLREAQRFARRHKAFRILIGHYTRNFRSDIFAAPVLPFVQQTRDLRSAFPGILMIRADRNTTRRD